LEFIIAKELDVGGLELDKELLAEIVLTLEVATPWPVEGVLLLTTVTVLSTDSTVGI
jgi:hypothetical protein